MAANSRGTTVVIFQRAGWARIALGPTRDVLIVEGPVEIFPAGNDDELAAAHAAAAGFDTREGDTPYSFIRLTPESTQAWRNAAELRGRYVMREGRWLD